MCRGVHCELECRPGRYGLECSQECDCSEEQSEGCHPVTGVCQCRHGWRGHRSGGDMIDKGDMIYMVGMVDTVDVVDMVDIQYIRYGRYTIY